MSNSDPRRTAGEERVGGAPRGEPQDVEPRLGPRCRFVDPRPYLSLLFERFGMSERWFTDRYRFFVGGRKYLYILSHAHAPPRGPEILFSGIKFMRIAMRIPKLTTEAAVGVGHLALRNYVDLGHDEAAKYFAREPVELESSAVAACTGAGYVLVRVGPFTVGTGYLEMGAIGEGPRLRSWFPKRMSTAAETI
ncbi:MAG: hypothetical protein ACLFRR_11520 [Spirochaetaceae bacterium]